MDKYKRYFGVVVFIIAITVLIFVAISIITPQYNDWNKLRDDVATVSSKLEEKQQEKANIIQKIKRLQESVISAQKRIYSPVENKLGNDTLFFTLYSDLIEMVRANTIKIKSIDYKYNPSSDVFVQQKGSMYFVCDVNMEVVSNYVNLGKLIQDIYQYPYYIRINKIDVMPYQKDKKILLSSISMRLYAHTSPDEYWAESIAEGEASGTDNNTQNKIDGAEKPLPQ